MPKYHASFRRDARKRKERTGMQVTNRSIFTLLHLASRPCAAAGDEVRRVPERAAPANTTRTRIGQGTERPQPEPVAAEEN